MIKSDTIIQKLA